MWGFVTLMLALVVSLIHALGILSAAHAIWNARTPQGSIAWSITLVLFPYLALPLYWVFGRDKFQGYVRALRFRRSPAAGAGKAHYGELLAKFWSPPEPHLAQTQIGFENLARFPFTRYNCVDLLIDGEATFAAIFEGIEQARHYILLEFYIIADDEIGREFKSRLIRRAREGIQIYLVYDAMGCFSLPRQYVQDLQDAGVHVFAFRPEARVSRLQLNFRNHRKITVVDGTLAFVGGFNIQDEYLGRSKFYGAWRDTHVRLEGPAVLSVQRAFCEDYYWASDGRLPLDLLVLPEPRESHTCAAVYLATGPADEADNGVLFFVHSINSARFRLWLASPYFVPLPSVLDALKMAAMRGVDVRIIIPLRWDLLVMYLAAFSYLPEAIAAGIKIYRYEPGHPHQKVMLIDDEVAWVGSSNLDARSLQLNFEGNLVVIGEQFADDVKTMLERDMSVSQRIGPEDYYRRGPIFKLGVKLARLFEAIL